VAEHVRVRPGDLDVGGLGEPAQAAGGRVPVHPCAAAVKQDRPACPEAYCPVDGSADGWRQRDQVSDVCAGGLEDPRAEQAEHGHQREVARVR
jgi:hypothetical protein